MHTTASSHQVVAVVPFPETTKRKRRMSCKQAAKQHRKMPESRVFSHSLLEVRDRNGRLKHRDCRVWKHNLTTDAASGYTNRRDWQSKAMGGGLGAFFGATAVGNATSTASTTLTNTGAAFPTSNQGLAGYIVFAGPNASGVGSTVFGVIVSNTATALTVDQWYNAGTGAAGTTPNGTCSYLIPPGQFPALFMAVSATVYAPLNTDTTLSGELTTNGFTRAIGTWAHTAAATTYTLQHTWTASGSEQLQIEAQFGACNTTAGGVMPFENTIPSPPPMVSGDTVQLTVTITIN
jgi:hypothetical protein